MAVPARHWPARWWTYPGRAVHIHFKIRTSASTAHADDAANACEFTSQLFFDDALTDQVFAQAPYAGKGARDVRNASDGIYREAGSQLVLAAETMDGGYRTRFDVGLDLSNAAVGKADHGGGPGGRGGPPRGSPPPRRRPA